MFAEERLGYGSFQFLKVPRRYLENYISERKNFLGIVPIRPKLRKGEGNGD